eukprot:TRINITY_DN10568_c0_g1_i17.p1 TRINITY_DN10568_c0_g1~~TRINITY_DN10568_c0_g1_i17.p1  ORF type:complete len:125 (-),score=20.10 TRINITY_DN10568_c0_g1_i17:493-867(-)
MCCFAIKLKHGPFSDEKLVSEHAESERLYEAVNAQKIPMWEWHSWVERVLTGPNGGQPGVPPSVRAADRVSRMCNWRSAGPGRTQSEAGAPVVENLSTQPDPVGEHKKICEPGRYEQSGSGSLL